MSTNNNPQPNWGAGGWSNDAPPPNGQGSQQQPPPPNSNQQNPQNTPNSHPSWAPAPAAQPQHPQGAGQPPNGQHPNNTLAPMPPQQQPQGALPPIQQAGQHYQLPPVHPMYGAPYQQGPPMGGYAPTQPAPRQRTAIACRYCRRRKIRCSGFEHSEDGRCTNCQRFSQECVFTPVSAQTQAFVPAHTVWRGQNPPPNAQLYGAYGQPLPQGGRDPYQQQPPPQQQQQPGQYPPPPPGYQQQPVYGQPAHPQEAGRKRGNDEPHTPTLPPPNPGAQSQLSYPNSDTQSNGDRPGTGRSNMVDVGIQVELIGGRERGS